MFLETVLFWGSGWSKTHHHPTSSYVWLFLSTPKPEDCLFSNKSSLLWGGLLQTIQKTKLLLSQCGARHLVFNVSLSTLYIQFHWSVCLRRRQKMLRVMLSQRWPRQWALAKFRGCSENICLYLYTIIIVL